MPYKPSRQCPGRGPHLNRCPNVIKDKGSYCHICSEYARKALKQHNRGYDKDRDATPERHFIHSVQWRKIRLMKLIKDPLCEECLKSEKETRAVLVHHIDGNELNNRHDNHSSVCTNCHEFLHKHERWGKKYE